MCFSTIALRKIKTRHTLRKALLNPPLQIFSENSSILEAPLKEPYPTLEVGWRFKVSVLLIGWGKATKLFSSCTMLGKLCMHFIVFATISCPFEPFEGKNLGRALECCFGLLYSQQGWKKPASHLCILLLMQWSQNTHKPNLKYLLICSKHIAVILSIMKMITI